MEIKIVADNTDEIIRKVNANARIALEAVALAGEGNAILEVNRAVYDTPESPNYVRTTNLKKQITHDSDDEWAYIGDNAEYAPYVEMGTSKMRGRPFIKPALDNHLAEYEEILTRYLNIDTV